MAVFRRDALTKIDSRYTSFRSCGDKLFWKSLAVQGKVLYVCTAVIYNDTFNIRCVSLISNIQRCSLERCRLGP